MPMPDFSNATLDTIDSLLQQFLSDQNNLRFYDQTTGCFASLEARNLITLDTLLLELGRVQSFNWFEFLLDLIHSRPEGKEDRQIANGMLLALKNVTEEMDYSFARICNLAMCLLAYSREPEDDEQIVAVLKNASKRTKTIPDEDDQESLLRILRQYGGIEINAFRDAVFAISTAGVEPSGENLLTDMQSGFVAGTLVHTEHGKVPIELIKVGDFVYSQSESASQKVLRQVTRLHRHEQKEIVRIEINGKHWSDLKRGLARTSAPYYRDNADYTLTVSRTHPLWDVVYGWTNAESLRGSSVSVLGLIDGRVGEVKDWKGIFITDKPEIGWIGNRPSSDGAPGLLWNCQTGEILKHHVVYDEELWDWGREGKQEGEDLRFLATVYDIEVDELHSYFVGDMGVCVCDASLNQGCRRESAIEMDVLRRKIDEYFSNE